MRPATVRNHVKEKESWKLHRLDLLHTPQEEIWCCGNPLQELVGLATKKTPTS
jgi:hypothetical protein